jgi:transmembrane sensor
MSDLAERLRAIGEHVDAGYDAGRTEAALARVRSKLQRRRATRIAVGSAATALCLAAGGFWAARGHHDHRSTPVPLVPQAEALFALGDGSVVTPLNPASRVVAKTVSDRWVELELVSGSAHFDVAPNRERTFRVDAGRVGITVVGTKFSVERQGERTAVAVQAGKVRVAWERGEQLLNPGERGVFPPFEMAVELTPPQGPVAGASESPPAQPRVAPPRRAADSRGTAEHGEGAAACRALADRGRPDGAASVDDLLLAADEARTSGHPADSVRYLERALALHQGEGRRAVVAFTLGRVLLADLHEPGRAAGAFATARAADPSGPLAEDALAREIEARHRAGDESRARGLAEEYLKTWPSGSRVRAVRHFGGLP